MRNHFPGLTWVQVEKRDLTIAGARSFTGLLRDLALRGEMIGFTFDGWGSDPRSIYDIPKVQAFMGWALPKRDDQTPDESVLTEFVQQLYDDSAFIDGAGLPVFGCYGYLLMAVGGIGGPSRSSTGRTLRSIDLESLTWANGVVFKACERVGR